eukprot:5179423-Pyramimonas_sp.AAC.1
MYSQCLALLERAPRCLRTAATGVAIAACNPRERSPAKAQPKRAALDRGGLNRMPTSLRHQSSNT